MLNLKIFQENWKSHFEEILCLGFFQLGQQQQYLKCCYEHFKDQRNIPKAFK